MNLVNHYFILEGNHGFTQLPCQTEKLINHTFMKLIINEDGYGKFQWGQEPFLLYGFEITLFRYDLRRIVCFTSNPSNVLKVKDLIKNTLGSDLKIDSIDMERNYFSENPLLKNFNFDPITGISFTISNVKLTWPILIKIYPTGLTTFNMINHEEIIKQIISLNVELLDTNIRCN